jgi:N-acetylmuramic acid 6-phosphate etherase
MSITKTEMRNPASMHMDKMSTEEMAKLVITANYEAVKAVEDATQSIAQAVDVIAEAFEKGGRLFYIGAGTSGRLGVLDAAECPPTFGVPHEQVQGIIAGGKERMFKAGENEEDKYEKGYAIIEEYGITANDVVVGISAAGNAAYVVGALDRAKLIGATTVGLSCNPNTKILNTADIKIFTDTGAEVITGSTRLKAGTATKMVLNTLTTASMIKIGNTISNLMINLRPSNEKLTDRCARICVELTGVDYAVALGEIQNGKTIREIYQRYKK